MTRLLGFCILISVAFSCYQSPQPTPRPHQYPRIEFPDRKYSPTEVDGCDFVVELPDYSKTQQKEFIFGEKPTHPCWFDIQFGPFNATVHLSYYPVLDQSGLDKLVEDAFTMAGKHNVKATFREEVEIENKSGTKGVAFKIEGPVASPYQFYVSDNKKHFLRGSLYFDQKVDRDSVQIVIDYIEEDIKHMISSLKWNG